MTDLSTQHDLTSELLSLPKTQEEWQALQLTGMFVEASMEDLGECRVITGFVVVEGLESEVVCIRVQILEKPFCTSEVDLKFCGI